MSKYTVDFTMKLSYCKNICYCQLDSFSAQKYICSVIDNIAHSPIDDIIYYFSDC